MRRRMNTLSAWLFAAASAVGLGGGTAHAAVITFNGNITGNFSGPFTATLGITDAAYLSGGIAFSIQPQAGYFCGSLSLFGPCLITGDASGFLSFFDSFAYSEFFPSNSASGRLSVGLSFNPDGTTTGSITLRGLYQDLNISSSAVGFVVADITPCYYGGLTFSSPTCQVTGSFSTLDVPEPSSGLVIGPALGLLLAASLRKAIRHRFSRT